MDILPGDENSSSEPRNFTIVGNELFFRASISIWKTDGTVPGTIQLMPINTSVTTDLVAFNDDLYFGAYDDAHGEELWKSNGAPSGTMILKDIETGIEPSFASNITAGEDLLYLLLKVEDLVSSYGRVTAQNQAQLWLKMLIRAQME